MVKLTENAQRSLIGRRISRVTENALILDTGKAIYLDQDEIDQLNDFYE